VVQCGSPAFSPAFFIVVLVCITHWVAVLQWVHIAAIVLLG